MNENRQLQEERGRPDVILGTAGSSFLSPQYRIQSSTSLSETDREDPSSPNSTALELDGQTAFLIWA